MNKKFNLLALAAAASACGALVLTSCGGSSGCKVIFWTNGDLRNKETGKVISIPSQTVAKGKYAKEPNLSDLSRKNAVRWTWQTTDNDIHALSVQGWSYENEQGSQEQNKFDFTKTPITKDTLLFPYYTSKAVYTITLEPMDAAGHLGVWNEKAQRDSHIYDDNYFEEGTTLANFKKSVEGASTLITPPKNLKFDFWYDQSAYPTGEDAQPFDFSGPVEEDIVLVAHYKTI